MSTLQRRKEHADRLKELIAQYWDTAYIEGQSHASSDTPNGDAQKVLSAINEKIDALVGPTDTLDTTLEALYEDAQDDVLRLHKEKVDLLMKYKYGQSKPEVVGYVAMIRYGKNPESWSYFSRITTKHQAEVCAADWKKNWCNDNGFSQAQVRPIILGPIEEEK